MNSKCSIVRAFREEKQTNKQISGYKGVRAAGIALGGKVQFKLHSMKPGKLHQLFRLLSSLHIPKDLIVPKEIH